MGNNNIFKLIEKNKINEVKEMINKDKSLLKLKSEDGAQVLYYALIFNRLEIVKFLVELGVDVETCNDWEEAPIVLAASIPKLEIFNYLIENCKDINYKSYEVLERVIDKSKYISDELLKGIIDKSDYVYEETLFSTLNYKRVDLYKYILEKRSFDLKAIYDSMNYLDRLSTDEFIEVIDYILENKQIGNLDSFLAQVLNNTNKLKVFKYLLEKGLDLNDALTIKGALFTMVKKGALEIVKFLVNSGADLHALGYLNRSILHYEAFLDYDEYDYYDYSEAEKEVNKTFIYLVENKVKLAQVDHNGKMALHYLNNYKRIKSVKYIFEDAVKEIMLELNKDNRKFVFDKLFSLQDVAPTKKEKKLLINSLLTFPEYQKEFNSQLNSKSVKLRDFAVKILIAFDDNKSFKILKTRYETETNKSIIKALKEYFDSKKKKTTVNIKKTSENYEKYSKSWFIDKSKASSFNIPVLWLKIKGLPDLYWLDKTKVEINIKKYLIKSLVKNPIINYETEECKELFALINLLEAKSLSDLARALYNMPKKLSVKDSWIFNIFILLAEKNKSTFEDIEHCIWFLGLSFKGVLAGKLLHSMINMKSIEGIKKVDWYSRKAKNKSVKKDALLALENKAKEKSLTIEELRDSLISNLGFNEAKNLILDYGARKIIVSLNNDLSLSFEDKNTEKKYKNLPKANKSDDKKKAKKSIEFIKEMKKEIKEVIKYQKERLEAYFISHHLLSFDYWENFYIKNPVLNIFASGLFWGVYKKKKSLIDKKSMVGENMVLPTQVFIYSGDGSFIDLDGNEVKIRKNAKIGLIHPIELTDEQLKKAKEIIDDFEIIQPIKQVEREVFETDEKLKELKDFNAKKFYPKSLHFNLLKNLWRPYIYNGGGVGFYEAYEIYSQEYDLKITIDLSYEYIDTAEKADEFAIISQVFFQQAKKIISLKSVNKRFYSEVYRSLILVTASEIK